jgi:hypothetical protein
MRSPNQGIVLANEFYEHLKSEARAKGTSTQLTVAIFERRYGLKPRTLSAFRGNRNQSHKLWRQRREQKKEFLVLRSGMPGLSNGAIA